MSVIIAISDDDWDEIFSFDPDLPGWNTDEALDFIDTIQGIIDNAPVYEDTRK